MTVQMRCYYTLGWTKYDCLETNTIWANKGKQFNSYIMHSISHTILIKTQAKLLKIMSYDRRFA